MKIERLFEIFDKYWRLLGLILLIPGFLILGIIVAYTLLSDSIIKVWEEY